MATGTQGHRDHILEKAKLPALPALPATGRRRRADGKPKKNFPCQECQKAFNSLEKLKVHSYSHTGERPYRCSHADCCKAFVSKYKLLRHTATHSPEKNHKCSYCEKMFHRKDHLKNHLHTHDPYKEAFSCQECGKSYNTKLGFKRHLALHAANSGDLTCQVCLQPFPSTAVLLEHLKTHAGKSSGGTKEKKHRCEHCERRFYTRKDVRRHMVVHTGRKDFLCQYCAQRFGRKDHLTRHVKKSHAAELLRVKTEPSDSLLEPLAAYDLAPAAAVKGELPAGMLSPRQPQLSMYSGGVLDSEPLPFSLKFPLAASFTSYGAAAAAATEREQLESYLMELQSAMPSSSSSAVAPGNQLPPPSKLELEPPGAGLDGAASNDHVSLSKVAAAAGDSLASSSSLMDFSQLFNFLPLNGPPYSQLGGVASGGGGVASGGGVVYPPTAEEPPAPLVQLPAPPNDGPDDTLPPPFISTLSSAPTLPRFHHAFQ